MRAMKYWAGILMIPSLCLATVAALSLDEVNQKIADLLQGFNGDKNKLEMVFTDLKVSENAVNDLGLRLQYRKVGIFNVFDLKIDPIKYTYNDGENSKTEVKARLDFNLLTFLGRRDLNEYGEGADDLVAGFVRQYSEEYGEAVELDAAVDEVVRTEAGDVESVKLHLNAVIRLEKLPQSMPADSVPVVAINASVEVGVTGLSLDLTFEGNYFYKGYGERREDLRSFVTKLLEGNEELYSSIQRGFAAVDGYVQRAVDHQGRD